MNRKLLFILLLSSQLYSQQQVDIPWPSLANSPWPMIAHDPQFTGRSPYVGPKTPTIVWTLDLPYGIFSGPIIGENGTLFVGTSSYLGFIGDTTNYFYAIDREGRIKWTYMTETPYSVASGLLINNEGIVFFGAVNDGWMYALDHKGELQWKKNFGSGVLFIMNSDLQGNLYISDFDDYLRSITKEGELNWKVKYGSGFGLSSPTISPDGNTIYIAGKDSNLYALRLDGSIKWVYNCWRITPPLTVDNSGNIYFSGGCSPPGLFTSIDSSGNLNWEYLVNNGNSFNSISSAAIDYSGNIYFMYLAQSGSENYCRIESIDYYGNYRWTYQFEQPGEWISMPLVVDKDGTIYCGSTWGYYYYAISNDGELLWKLPLNEYQVDQTTAISSDGTLYIGVHKSSTNITQEKTLIAIRDTGTVSVHDITFEEFDYKLFQNYPNPFNPTTKIIWQSPVESLQTLKIIDILGREVAVLVNEYKPAGKYEIEFDAAALPSGVYYYSLQSGEFRESKKMILLR